MSRERINLVTGACGFCGQYVVRELLRANQRVIATDLPSAVQSESVRAQMRSIGVELDHDKLEWIGADLLDQRSIAPLFEREVTHIFHTASLYDYSAPLEKLIRVNVDGTRNLLAEAEKAPLARFVHWSTCGVFGQPFTAAHGAKANIPFTEESSSPKTALNGADGPAGTKLVNEYSISKWQQEKMMWKAHRERGLPLTVVRPAPIYGPGSTYGHGGIILAVANGLIPAIPTDAKNYITSSVHVEDIARFAVYSCDRDDTVGEDYNVVDNSVVSYYEFVHYIALLTGRKLADLPFVKLTRGKWVMKAAAEAWRFLEVKFKVPRIRVFEPQSANYVSSSYWLSNRKSLATGFEYKYADVREGLKDTISWFRRQGWLTDRKRLFVVAPQGAKAPATHEYR